MFTKEDIAVLLAESRRHFEELMGSSPARASDSESDGEEAASSAPAIDGAFPDGSGAGL